jgi:mannonate dehydratase
MPVFDWLRSDLSYKNEDGSTSLVYRDATVLSLDPRKGDLSLPGWDSSYTKEGLDALLNEYKDVDEEKLWENMKYFLEKIIPVCEECDVKMAIHPDDPPWGIFGLPRVITNEENLDKFLKLVDSPYNGLTLCTGSLGGSPYNNEVAIFKEFAHRVYFCHLRNIRHIRKGFFHESESHLFGKVDMINLVKEILIEEARRGEGIVFRPDHGRHLEIDRARTCYGGYDYGGRLVGLAELRGLAYGIEYEMNRANAK